MMNRLTEKLHSGSFSCVIATTEGTVRTFHRRGITDLFITLKNEPDVLRGAMVADKVVGKAAAALMVLGGVSRIHADVISTPALSLLQSHGIGVEFTTETDHIVNRAGTGWCPMEELSRDENSPEAIRDKVEQFLRGSAACSLDNTNKPQTPLSGTQQKTDNA